MHINKNIAISESGFIFNPSTGDSFSTNHLGQDIIDADGSLNSGYFLTESSTTLIEGDGTVRYSYRTTEPFKVDLTCSGRKPKPVSGSITNEYNDNDIEVNFGNGSCDNRSVTVTINGVTKARNING